MENRLEDILEVLETEDVIKLDGLDGAVIGYCGNSYRLIYSKEKILDILMEYNTEEESIEYYYFNIVGLCINEGMPILCEDC